MRYRSIAHIKSENKWSAGHHFFDPATMECFRSIVHPDLFGGRYFVTSEVGPWGPDGQDERRYTVRFADDNAHIQTVGYFGAYATLTEAQTAAAAAAGKEVAP